MSATIDDTVRIADMPDLGAVTDDSSFVGEHAGSGRFSALALKSYLTPPASSFVSSVSTGTGLTGGPITTTGTISLADTAVTPGTFAFATIQVDQQGRLTSAKDGTSTASALYVSKGGDTLSGDLTVLADFGVTGGGTFGTLGISGTTYMGGNVTMASGATVSGAITASSISISGTASLGSVAVGGNGVIYASFHPTNGFAFTNLSGTVYCYENGSSVGTLVPPSSALVKEDIALSGYDCLGAVLRTPLFSFRYRDTDQTKPVGFIAERQHEVFPESALMLDGKPFGIDIMTVVATLYGAVQQLSRQVADLTAAAMKA